MLDKKDWICTQPFEFSEIFDHKMFMCCPNWLPVDLGNPNNIADNWQSSRAEDVRKSIIDGTYKYCIESRCPKLTGLKENKTDGFISRKEFNERKNEFVGALPRSLKFNFDQSCNLKCPSCRPHFINYEGYQRERTEELISNIENQLSNNLTHIECTGSGDPFFSRTFRKWMMNFDPTKYPKLDSIHLHTNATLWNKSNWERMQAIHPYVKSCEISIDAATKETYETKVRLGGDWDKLIENLYYISSLPDLGTLTFSFVVQKDNYQEMCDFVTLIKDIFEPTNKNWSIFFNRVVNWGHWTEEQFKQIDIGDPSHPDFTLLMDLYKQLPESDNIKHNLTVL